MHSTKIDDSGSGVRTAEAASSSVGSKDKDGASVKEDVSSAPAASFCSFCFPRSDRYVPLQSDSGTANPEYFPMYVISVQNVLNLSSPLPPHQELQAQGKLLGSPVETRGGGGTSR